MLTQILSVVKIRSLYSVQSSLCHQKRSTGTFLLGNAKYMDMYTPVLSHTKRPTWRLHLPLAISRSLLESYINTRQTFETACKCANVQILYN